MHSNFAASMPKPSNSSWIKDLRLRPICCLLQSRIWTWSPGQLRGTHQGICRRWIFHSSLWRTWRDSASGQTSARGLDSPATQKTSPKMTFLSLRLMPTIQRTEGSGEGRGRVETRRIEEVDELGPVEWIVPELPSPDIGCRQDPSSLSN